jgi:FkbH-like protein
VTLAEALKIVQNAPDEAGSFDVMLACGFTPLHLRTFLCAHLQQRLPQRSVRVGVGLYGDLLGTLERTSGESVHALAIALEWSDLDPRLGYRSTGSWGESAIRDALNVAAAALRQLASAIVRVPSHVRIAISLPTLPLPPLFRTPGWQASEKELLLEHELSGFALELAGRRGLAVANQRRLEEESPSPRYHLKSDLSLGLPHTPAHADALAFTLARLLAPAAPKKGIITDLDDALWDGIVGEVGPDGVSWDLASHHHLHGLYQKLLASLSGRGILVGVASKNDPAVVEKVFQRPDLLLPSDGVFPFEVHWNAKSSSVARILEVWNIAADAVIFVDDSPMELAEVAAAHPGIRCVRFPKGDYQAGLAMMGELRDLCAKDEVSAEDSFRLGSIRQAAQFQRLASTSPAPESFIEQTDASVTVDWCPAAGDSRALELVNKTNQFNLNGVRFTETDWQMRLSQPDGVLAVLSYEDKFGQLGRIAVIQGNRNGLVLDVGVWVMSCRAFARRIEHQCLKALFSRLGVSEIRFAFQPTPKNGPIQEFFAGILGWKPEGPFSIVRARFEAKCPPLYHRVNELGSAT